MKAVAIKFLLIIIITLFCHCSIARDEVTVVTEYLAPYQTKNADGTLSGYATEVVEALFQLTQDQAHIQVLPWARAYEIASNQKNVLIYSITRSPAREPNFHWLGALDKQSFHFWALKKNIEHPAQSLKELKYLSVASSKAYASELFLTKKGFTNIYSVMEEQQIVQMLQRGRVELILSDRFVFKTIIKQLKYNPNDFVSVYLVDELSRPLCIAASKNSDPDFIARYQQAFKQLETSGKLSQIKRKWGIKTKYSPIKLTQFLH